ncbi:hypothetical protein KUL42_07120 [Alteromonas sp. KUL42]|nr:hypothetical protein KUL42_07120 [Alteromonas sp. KUL42]
MIGKRLSTAESIDVTGPASVVGPKHVAIIMDGNGRWAQKKGKSARSGTKPVLNQCVPSCVSLVKMVLSR